MSHPTQGAWIEIKELSKGYECTKSHPTQGAWIEITWIWELARHEQSHPTQGAWIEIIGPYFVLIIGVVAPHTGCVD